MDPKMSFQDMLAGMKREADRAKEEYEKAEDARLNSLLTTRQMLSYLKGRDSQGIVGVFKKWIGEPGTSQIDWRTKKVFEMVLERLFDNLIGE